MDVIDAVATPAEATGAAYRDAREVLLARHRSAVAALQSHVEHPAVRAVFAARAARTVAGAVGVLGALAVAGIAAAVHLPGARTGSALLAGDDPVLTRALEWAVAAALFAWPAAWLVAARSAGPALRRAARALARLPEGDPLARAEELSSPDALRGLLARAGAGEAAGAGLPLAALSLLAPLALHLAFVAAVDDTLRFGGWIAMSLALVGHCHLILAYLGLRHALDLSHSREPFPTGAGAGWRALLWVTLASAVPGAVLLAVPVVLVALTGALFVPAAWAWAARRVRREREALREAWREGAGVARAVLRR